MSYAWITGNLAPLPARQPSRQRWRMATQGLSEVRWSNYYRPPTYRILSFPHVMRKRMAGERFARLISVTAPFSFYLLRAWAAATGTRFDPTAGLAEFSHDFFLFHRRSEDDLHGEITTAARRRNGRGSVQ